MKRMWILFLCLLLVAASLSCGGAHSLSELQEAFNSQTEGGEQSFVPALETLVPPAEKTSEPIVEETSEPTAENTAAPQSAQTDDSASDAVLGVAQYHTVPESFSSISLTKVGETSRELRTTYYDNGGVYYRDYRVDRSGIVALDGSRDTGLQYSSVELLDYDYSGLYEVTCANGSANNTGVVDLYANTILECSAAIIKQLNDRYLFVYYATNTTTNEDAALLYTYSGNIKTYYEGYILVYDMVLGRFMPNVRITAVDYSRGACGQYFFDGEVLYDANGDAVMQAYAVSNELIQQKEYANSGYHTVLYDEELNVVSDVRLNLGFIDGTDQYFSVYNNGSYDICDRSGKTLFTLPNGESPRECCWNSLLFSHDNLYTMQGKKVCEYDTYTKGSNGYVTVKKYDGTYDVVNKRGTIVATDVKGDPEYQVWGNMGSGSINLYNMQTAECSLHINDVKTDSTDAFEGIGPFLAAVRTTANGYALYETLTGKKLLDAGYDEILYANGYIYAYTSGTYTIYEVNFS